MNDKEVLEHFQYIDGVQLAHTIALRALLSNDVEVAKQLQNFMASAGAHQVFSELSVIKLESFEREMNNLVDSSVRTRTQEDGCSTASAFIPS